MSRASRIARRAPLFVDLVTFPVRCSPKHSNLELIADKSTYFVAALSSPKHPPAQAVAALKPEKEAQR